MTVEFSNINVTVDIERRVFHGVEDVLKKELIREV